MVKYPVGLRIQGRVLDRVSRAVQDWKSRGGSWIRKSRGGFLIYNLGAAPKLTVRPLDLAWSIAHALIMPDEWEQDRSRDYALLLSYAALHTPFLWIVTITVYGQIFDAAGIRTHCFWASSHSWIERATRLGCSDTRLRVYRQVLV